MIKQNEQKQLRLEAFQLTAKLLAAGNQAIARVREENKRLGLPLVFSRNGIIYYELPDGTITANYTYPKQPGTEQK